MLKCVGAIGPPGLRERLGRSRARVESEPLERTLDAEVGCEEGVWITKRAHGDVARSPRADAGKSEEAIFGIAPVGIRIEHEIAGGQSRGEPADRTHPEGRQGHGSAPAPPAIEGPPANASGAGNAWVM